MKLGFAVKVVGRQDLRSHDTRRWQSHPSLGRSIEHLHELFDYLAEIDVRMYRMSSGVAPYASHPQMTQFRDQPQRFAAELASLGERARKQGLRLSMHPGQYTVLNSENSDTVEAAIEELEVHAELLDGMGLGPEAVVVLHIGGAAGGKTAALDRFEKGFARLSERAQARLVIENDDRSFGLADVLDLSQRTNTRVVWDILHHHCYDPERIDDREALRLAIDTWPEGVTPKMHYSTPRTDLDERKKKVGRKTIVLPVVPPLRAHADLIDPIGFESFLRDVVVDVDVDVMLEAKGKDIALLELRKHLARREIDPGG